MSTLANPYAIKPNDEISFVTRDDDNNVVPVRYMMMGYDSLLGSHFDKYEIIYDDYTPGPVDGDVFDVKSVTG